MKILCYYRIIYMPKKVLSNEMKGGDKVYNYNANKEWITGYNKLGNIDFLNDFEKGGRSLNERESSTKIDPTNDIDEDMYKLDSNKKEIDTAIQTLKNSEPLIDKLAVLKNKLNAEIRAIKSKDITSLDPVEVADDIKRGVPLVGRYITNKSITTNSSFSNPVNSANLIIKYARQMDKGKSGRPIERENNNIEENWEGLKLNKGSDVVKRKEIKKILDEEGEDIIKFNIESIMGWRHIDLSKWPIGSINNYIHFVWLLLKKHNDKYEINWDSDDGKWILNWFVKIAGKFYTGGGDNIGLEEYIKSKITVKNLLKSELSKHFFSISESDDVVDFTDNTWSEFVKNLNKLIETYSNKKKNKKEYLVILLHWLFTYSISILNKFKNILKGNGFSNDNLNAFGESIKAVDLLWKNGLQTFFKIKVVAKKYGVIDHGTKDGKFDPLKKDWHWRVIGGDKSIEADTKFNRTTYPIVVESIGNSDKDFVLNEKETKERLTKILLAVEKDYHSNKLITVGGILPKENIAKITLYLVRMYLENGLKIKNKNIKTINEMMRKMKNKVHIRYLINTKNMLRLLYQRISDEYMSNIKKMIAKKIIDEIVDIYDNLKKKESDKIFDIYKIIGLIDEEKNKLSGSIDVIDKLQVQRERLLIDINQSQLKALAFKLIALNLYKKMQIEVRSKFDTNEYDNAKYEAKLMMTKISKDKLPEKYFDLLNDNFDKIDKKYNSNIKDFFKDKKDFKKMTGEMIIDSLGYKKSYHPEFWNKIFSNKNIDDIDDNGDDGDNGDIGDNGDNDDNNFSSKEINNRDLSNSEKKIVKQKFWLDVRDKLGGKTIYIPFIKKEPILFDKFGLFDVLEACIRGRIDKELLIFGKELTLPVISQAIRPRGSIIVCEMEDNKDRPTRWRVILKKELDIFAKMNENDLRVHFYKTLSDKSVYNRRASLYWYNDKKLFNNVLKYCRSLKSYQDCELIISREEISKKLNNVDGIKF